MTFRRPSPEDLQAQRTARREANMRALCTTSRALTRGTYASDIGNPISVPKPRPYRDPALLEMARGRPCLLLVPGVCNHRQDTTVAAHSNLLIHGKAKGRKADDCYSCWSCAACHQWLDQGRTDAVLKEMTFMQGHLQQVLAWRQVAADTAEPERLRRAAQRALERLNATPLPEAP